jgi:histidinol-phosphate aminotransferase
LSAAEWIRQRLKETVREVYIPSGDAVPSIPDGGLSRKGLVRLDANENLLFPHSLLSAVLREVVDEVDVRTYPRLEEERLNEAIADYLNFPTNQIVVSNGSDPLIESCVKAFLKGDEEAISISPTFAMYKIITRNHGFDYVEVPLNEDFSLNVDVFFSEVKANTVLCFLNSPNNPTGNQFPLANVKKIVEAFKGFVVIDEAYVDFAPYSVLDLIEKSENLIVLRTFSKAFGLAGLRIGYSLSNSGVTDALKRIQLPFNVNKVSLAMARKVLEQREVIADVVTLVKTERSKLFKRMNRISGVTAYNSDANFILFKTEKDPDKIYHGLQKKGLLIRRFKSILGRGVFLRVTVGLPEMNTNFTDSLRELCGE